MTVVNQVRLEGPLNQFVVQWDVPGALDGTRLAPGLTVINNGIIAGQQDEDAVFRIQCPGSAGIFDADALGKSGCYGDRYVQWIKIDAAVPINPGFGIFVVDDTGLDPSLGVPLQLQEVTLGQTFTGLSSFYFAEMFLVPQGCAIQIVGLGPAPAGTSHGVKMGIRSASTGREDANLQGAMCCEEGAGQGGGVTPTPTPSVSREFYTFSSTLNLGPGDTDNFLRFGGGVDYTANLPPNPTNNQSETVLPPDEGGDASVSAEKIAIRDGSVTAISVMHDAVAPMTMTPFVEVAVAGVFVRTLTSAPVVVVPNTVTPITVAAVPFAATNRIRAGIIITLLTITAFTIQVELEITTPG
jgi:hypothetical protein